MKCETILNRIIWELIGGITYYFNIGSHNTSKFKANQIHSIVKRKSYIIL